MRGNASTLAAATILALLATSCASETTAPRIDSVVVPAPTLPSTNPAASTTQSTFSSTPATTLPPADVTIGLVAIAEFDEPLALIARPDDERLFILERSGLVIPFDPQNGTTGEALLDLSAEVATSVERGLLGGAFSNDGSKLFLHYSDLNGDTRLDEWTMDGELLDRDSRRFLFAVSQPFGNHNGGQVEIGPDGFLYLGLGDGGAGGDPLGSGQDTTTTLGSIIRIDPTSGDRYAIPADNPFADGGGAPEIFLWGVRNPWRFSFDSATGDLWIADVGQNRLEEVTVLRASDGAGNGANLGWALREGSEEFSGPEPEGHVEPIYEYSHDDGSCSVTGGYVYRGTEIPGLVGQYLFADYCVADIVTVSQTGKTELLGLSVEGGQVVSFGQDQNGEIYVMSQQGQLARLAVVPS
ncbi:MAG: PQQ-dependent sugar dehydrogenase [Acidimicrobiales bacterium]